VPFLQHTCDTLQQTATHCNTLRHTATHRYTLATHCSTPQHTATHCTTLQHTATHGSTLQRTATNLRHSCSTPQHAAAHRSTPQHTATQSTPVLAATAVAEKRHFFADDSAAVSEPFLRKGTSCWHRGQLDLCLTGCAIICFFALLWVRDVGMRYRVAKTHRIS